MEELRGGLSDAWVLLNRVWMLGSRGDFPPEHLDLWRVVGPNPG